MIKQVKEMKKNHPRSKNENRNNKEITRGDNPGIRKPGKGSGVIDTTITNRIQEIEERISGVKDTIENIDTSVKENTKCKNLLPKYTEKIQ